MIKMNEIKLKILLFKQYLNINVLMQFMFCNCLSFLFILIILFYKIIERETERKNFILCKK